MKKILIFIACLTVLLSCKKSSYVANFDQLPQERAGAQIAEVLALLTSAENGWIASLPTDAGGGYGFYISFDNEQNVKMYGDMTDQSASILGKSYYRVKQDMGTDLVFDTYNYISMLADPDSKVLGGIDKVGFRSDVEFIYQRSSGDSAVFIGKKYRQPLKMVKATAAQKAIYEAGGYKPAINKLKAYFDANPNSYIELGTGTNLVKVGIEPQMTNALTLGKSINFVTIVNDKAISTTQKFSFTLTGLSILNGGLDFQGLKFVKMDWKTATTLALYDNTGKEYLVKSSLAPLIPLNQLLGSKYKAMLSEKKIIYPGTSVDGAKPLKYFYDNLNVPAVSTYLFDYGRINMTWDAVNNRLTVVAVVGQTNASGVLTTWATTSIYSYTMDANGVFKFTMIQTPSSNYAIQLISEFHKYILNNRMKIDYYIDNNVLYGRLTSVDNPSSVMTFLLQ